MSNSFSLATRRSTRIRDLARLNLLLSLNEHRSMQTIQPEHLDGSAVIDLLSLFTLIVIYADYNRKPARIVVSMRAGFESQLA